MTRRTPPTGDKMVSLMQAERSMDQRQRGILRVVAQRHDNGSSGTGDGCAFIRTRTNVIAFFSKRDCTRDVTLFTRLGHIPCPVPSSLLVLSPSSSSPNNATRAPTSSTTPLPFLPKALLSPLPHPPRRRQNTRRYCATSCCAHSSKATRRLPRPETNPGRHSDKCARIPPRRKEKVALRVHAAPC
jgi:hypothetical protein